MISIDEGMKISSMTIASDRMSSGGIDRRMAQPSTQTKALGKALWAEVK
jgi:hypothetical protein